MEKAREVLSLRKEETSRVSDLHALTRRTGFPTFFEAFTFRGIRVDRIEPGLVVYSLRVPPHLTDAQENLSPGAIAGIVDAAGAIAAISSGLPAQVTVNLSVQYISDAKIGDELEITARLVKNQGTYSNTSISVRNKGSGELVVKCLQLCSDKPRVRI